jgi:CheY-like chemotaxis protein
MLAISEFGDVHVLIIEDDLLIAWTLRGMLSKFGFSSAETAATEETAVSAANAHRPDLITADVYLAAGTGPEAVRRILTDAAIPVVFITGNPEAVARGTAFPVIGKPISERALRLAVREALGRPDCQSDPH